MTKSSRHWLKEHFTDPYVKKSQQEGYRSRAAYKLLEIQTKDQIIKPGMLAVDLGASPGGWSQVVAKLLKNSGKIFALDILPMQPLPNVDFLQGDFTESEIIENLLTRINKTKIDLVLSDMAPNMSGIASADQAKAMYLAETALIFANKVLKKNGIFLVKMFQGAGFEGFMKDLRTVFKDVKVRKPKASRSRSKELFLLAKGFKTL